MEHQELARWLANLPDDQIEYIDWLIEKVDTSLDKMLLEQSDLEDAKIVLKKFTLFK